MEYIIDSLLGCILNGSKYIIGEFNLIKNDWVVELDHQAHTDYLPRLAKRVIVSITNQN